MKNQNHNCKQELQELDLRATPARLAVLKLLENSEIPLDINFISEALRKSRNAPDQATIFRIMNSFTDKGLTRQINLNEGKSRYELSAMEKHHHLICQSCGRIEDISDCPIDLHENKIQDKKKFIIKTHSLEFFGICKNCQL